MAEKTKIVWREWYNETAVKSMTEMGTLPREETEIDCRFEDGEGVARLVAEMAYMDSGYQYFREGGDIIILEPEQFAGTYEITLDFEPVFSAYVSDN